MTNGDMTENWIKQTVRKLLEQATDAVVRLNLEEAQELVRTAQKVDPEEPELAKITNIIQGLIESQQPASQDSLSTDEGTDRDSQESIPEAITPEQSDQPANWTTFPAGEDEDILTPDDEGDIVDDATNREAVPGWRMGIDFGTSNTRIALNVPDEPPKLINIGEGVGEQAFMMPSVVAFHKDDGSIAALVGEDAVDRLEDPDWEVVRHIKRLLVVESDPQDAEHLQGVFSEVRENFRFLNDLPKPQTSRSVARLIITEALKRAQNEIDQDHARNNAAGPLLDLNALPVTLGVWGSAGLKARKTSGELLTESTNTSERPISDFEPCLAAQSSIKYDPNGSFGTTAIFDLGGGTFDVCVVEVDEKQEISMLSAGSHPLAGGSDIEQNIFNLARKKIAEEVGMQTDSVMGYLDDQPVLRGSLESQVRLVVADHPVNIGNQEIKLNNFLGHTVSIKMSYDEIAASVEATQTTQGGNLIDDVMKEFKRCVMRARNNVKDQDDEATTQFPKVIEEGFLKRVVLIGGGSRFPAIKTAVEAAVEPGDVEVKFDNDMGGGINPFFAIVLGAAQTDAKSRTEVFDRPSFSLLINNRQVYPAFTSTTVHSPNSLGSAITLRTFPFPENLEPGWEAKIVNETGDTVHSKRFEDLIFGPINVSFTRYGQFIIDGSGDKETIDLPGEYISKRQLGIRNKKIQSEQKAAEEADLSLRKNLRPKYPWNK